MIVAFTPSDAAIFSGVVEAIWDMRSATEGLEGVAAAWVPSAVAAGSGAFGIEMTKLARSEPALMSRAIHSAGTPYISASW